MFVKRNRFDSLLEVEKKYQAYSSSQDVLTGSVFTDSSYSNNRYFGVDSVITELARKYDGTSPWGCMLTGNIVDFRSSVIVGTGPQYKLNKEIVDVEKSPMNLWLEKFWEVNQLDHEYPQDLALMAELEGKCLVQLIWDDEEKIVRLLHHSYVGQPYVVINVDKNPLEIEMVVVKETTGKKGFSIPASECVYKKFGGRHGDLNVSLPKIGRCITQIENIDMAFRDWREINRLYGSPIPMFFFKTPQAVQQFTAWMENKNWKIKRFIALAEAEFKYAVPDSSGLDGIEKEIQRLACFISGATGYPLQFLLPDMLSNRSTSENIMESALAQTSKERIVWKGFYQELIEKAFEMYKANAKLTAFDASMVTIDIPIMTDEQWNRLTTVYMPLSKMGKISDETLLGLVPGIDVQAEMDAKEERDKEELQQIADELDATKQAADAAGVKLQRPGQIPPKGNGPERREQ